MTRNKDLKRLVRARMKKTGESYTSARAQITRKAHNATRASAAVAPKAEPPAPNTYARLAGMSDAKIKEATGCNWQKWVKALDHHGAASMSHREIADMVKTKYKTPDWWTQTVTVGYERIKGLRARGQRRNGTFEATKSRTFDVPVAELFDAWNDEPTRRKWMDGASIRIRTATAPKSMRLDWNGAIVAVNFYPKAKGKSSVAVQHAGLASKAAADEIKQYWTERLDTLKGVLGS